ncbi:MAG: hypothetical protein KF852_08240 [Saprospiraceae bacterium]|nr:hypothetical protein [Saprospiraceae bacterium]
MMTLGGVFFKKKNLPAFAYTFETERRHLRRKRSVYLLLKQTISQNCLVYFVIFAGKNLPKRELPL